MVEPVFPEAAIGPLTYILIGFLLTLVIFLLVLVYRIISSEEDDEMDVKRLRMPESRISVLEEIIEEKCMQNRLPELTGYSKSTVSQAISELEERGFIIRKKRGNSYLVEAKRDYIKERISDKDYS